MKKINIQKVHFIGIGGIGMSSLARWYLSQNWLVTGSDAQKSGIIQELIKEGVKIKIGHKKDNISRDVNLVVHTSAISPDNPELETAREFNIPVKKYSESLGDLTRRYKTIAVCGSHGKSSTTAMIASILIKAKMDPTVIIGTKLNGWNFRAGKSEWLVIEADEYKGAFWNYNPCAAILTNIDFEHVDFYKNLADVKNSFLKFLLNTEKFAVINKDNINAYQVSQNIKIKAKKTEIIYFSSSDNALVLKIKKVIKVPGNHNIMNALSAYKLGKKIGIKEDIILKAIASYKGVWRRIEYKGITEKGIKLFDDYAHHPTEIRATLEALRSKFPDKKIAVCFEPHQQRRLTALYKDFVRSWDNADYVLLIRVYNPAGRDEKSDIKNSETLTDDINKIYPKKAIYIGAKKNIKKQINKLPLNKNDILVIMGAGGIADITPLLCKAK